MKTAMQLELNLNLEQTKPDSVPDPPSTVIVCCPDCDGSGRGRRLDVDRYAGCPACNGTGELEMYPDEARSFCEDHLLCIECLGWGCMRMRCFAGREMEALNGGLDE